MRALWGEVKGMLREAAEAPPVAIIGPFRRGRGDYTAVISFTWPTFKNERAWQRLGRLSQKYGGTTLPLTREEREHSRAGFRDTAYAVQLSADNEREAEFQLRMLAADVEGQGFDIDVKHAQPPVTGPYR